MQPYSQPQATVATPGGGAYTINNNVQIHHHYASSASKHSHAAHPHASHPIAAAAATERGMLYGAHHADAQSSFATMPSQHRPNDSPTKTVHFNAPSPRNFTAQQQQQMASASVTPTASTTQPGGSGYGQVTHVIRNPRNKAPSPIGLETISSLNGTRMSSNSPTQISQHSHHSNSPRCMGTFNPRHQQQQQVPQNGASSSSIATHSESQSVTHMRGCTAHSSYPHQHQQQQHHHHQRCSHRAHRYPSQSSYHGSSYPPTPQQRRYPHYESSYPPPPSLQQQQHPQQQQQQHGNMRHNHRTHNSKNAACSAHHNLGSHAQPQTQPLLGKRKHEDVYLPSSSSVSSGMNPTHNAAHAHESIAYRHRMDHNCSHAHSRSDASSSMSSSVHSNMPSNFLPPSTKRRKIAYPNSAETQPVPHYSRHPQLQPQEHHARNTNYASPQSMRTCGQLPYGSQNMPIRISPSTNSDRTSQTQSIAAANNFSAPQLTIAPTYLQPNGASMQPFDAQSSLRFKTNNINQPYHAANSSVSNANSSHSQDASTVLTVRSNASGGIPRMTSPRRLLPTIMALPCISGMDRLNSPTKATLAGAPNLSFASTFTTPFPTLASSRPPHGPHPSSLVSYYPTPQLIPTAPIARPVLTMSSPTTTHFSAMRIQFPPNPAVTAAAAAAALQPNLINIPHPNAQPLTVFHDNAVARNTKTQIQSNPGVTTVQLIGDDGDDDDDDVDLHALMMEQQQTKFSQNENVETNENGNEQEVNDDDNDNDVSSNNTTTHSSSDDDPTQTTLTTMRTEDLFENDEYELFCRRRQRLEHKLGWDMPLKIDMEDIGPLPPFPLSFEEVYGENGQDNDAVAISMDNNINDIDMNANTKQLSMYVHDFQANKQALLALYDIEDRELIDRDATLLRLATSHDQTLNCKKITTADVNGDKIEIEAEADGDDDDEGDNGVVVDTEQAKLQQMFFFQNFTASMIGSVKSGTTKALRVLEKTYTTHNQYNLTHAMAKRLHPKQCIKMPSEIQHERKHQLEMERQKLPNVEAYHLPLVCTYKPQPLQLPQPVKNATEVTDVNEATAVTAAAVNIMDESASSMICNADEMTSQGSRCTARSSKPAGNSSHNNGYLDERNFTKAQLDGAIRDDLGNLIFVPSAEGGFLRDGEVMSGNAVSCQFCETMVECTGIALAVHSRFWICAHCKNAFRIAVKHNQRRNEYRLKDAPFVGLGASESDMDVDTTDEYPRLEDRDKKVKKKLKKPKLVKKPKPNFVKKVPFCDVHTAFAPIIYSVRGGTEQYVFREFEKEDLKALHILDVKMTQELLGNVHECYGRLWLHQKTDPQRTTHHSWRTIACCRLLDAADVERVERVEQDKKQKQQRAMQKIKANLKLKQQQQKLSGENGDNDADVIDEENRFIRNVYELHGHDDEEDDGNTETSSFKKSMKYHSVPCVSSASVEYVQKMESEPIGFAMYEHKNSKNLSKRYTELFWILVDNEHQRRGLASRLMDVMMMQSAKEEATSSFRLHVLTDNKAAMPLYRNTGFIKQKFKPNYPHAPHNSFRCMKAL